MSVPVYFHNCVSILLQLCKYTSIVSRSDFCLQYNHNNISKKKTPRLLKSRGFLDRIKQGFFPSANDIIEELSQLCKYTSIVKINPVSILTHSYDSKMLFKKVDHEKN